MRRKLLRLYIALLVAALSAYGGILYAQANPDITLAPGQSYTVACAKRLVVTGIFTKSVRLTCPGNGTVPPITASATVPPVATATPVLLPTVTPTPVVTPVMPLPTPTGPLPTNTPVAALIGHWHAPGAHDGSNAHSHFEAPPQWVTDWSMAEFGHGLEYGGDENSGPMEMAMKETAYKGITAVSDAGGQVYLRYHAASNPLDRSARYHSYEVYYKDTTGNVSFWQGWYDSGDPNTDARCPRRVPPIACEDQRPIILVVDQTSINQGVASEQWYLAGSPQSGVSWDMGITIIGSTTLYKAGENATAADQSTWTLTGNKGMQIRSDGFWYLGRGGGGKEVVGWYCAEPLGKIVSAGKTCAPGSLPQYIAATLAADARPDGFGNTRVQWLIEKKMQGENVVQIPN